MNTSAKIWLWPIGIIIMGTSLWAMLVFHEYSTSYLGIIIGIILAGYAYANFPNKPKINTDQVNKNIQNYNDLLWGKEKEKKEENTTIIIIKK